MIKERRNPRKFGVLYSPNAMENSWVFKTLTKKGQVFGA